MNKKYIRRVLALIPCSLREKRWLRERITEAVEPYAELGYEGLCEKLGKPETLAATYVEEMDTAELLKKLNLRMRTFALFVAVALTVFVSWATAVTYVLIDYQISKDSQNILVIDQRVSQRYVLDADGNIMYYLDEGEN